jgi:hypothetical protein
VARLTDTDIRYRRRYVDFVANPEAAAVMRARSLIVQGLRDFLDREGFLEVETPTLHDARRRARRRGRSRRTTTRSISSSRCASRSAPLEAPARRRLRACLRDRAVVTATKGSARPQPRVHAARVLPGVRDVRDAHGDDRSAVSHRRRVSSATGSRAPGFGATENASPRLDRSRFRSVSRASRCATPSSRRSNA